MQLIIVLIIVFGISYYFKGLNAFDKYNSLKLMFKKWIIKI